VLGAENFARIIVKYGSTGCGAGILAAVKQNPRDNRDLQVSNKDMASLRHVAARMKYRFDCKETNVSHGGSCKSSLGLHADCNGLSTNSPSRSSIACKNCQHSDRQGAVT
jgi:hypothetical protein